MASEFVVVDLYSQRHEVENHVRGCTEEQVLSWLSCFGDVHELKPMGISGLYSFRSVVGLVTVFGLDGNDGMSVKHW